MDIKILPLAITMMAGPQILFSILLVTQDKPVKLSLAYIAAIALATTVGLTITTYLASFLGNLNIASEGNTPTGRYIEIALVILLIFLSVRTFINRKNIKAPKWMASLKSLEVKKVFIIGLLMIFLMPSDVVVMLTVGAHLFSEKLTLIAAAPFIALTVFIAALPLITYLLFRKKAKVLMPKARDWMANNSAIVNIAIYILFIILILT